MTIFVQPLKESQIIAAEEELGTRLVKSLRNFLLNDKWLIMDDDLEIPLHIIPYSVFIKNYKNVKISHVKGLLTAERV